MREIGGTNQARILRVVLILIFISHFLVKRYSDIYSMGGIFFLLFLYSYEVPNLSTLSIFTNFEVTAMFSMSKEYCHTIELKN